jgi:hypothetical protein
LAFFYFVSCFSFLKKKKKWKEKPKVLKNDPMPSNVIPSHPIQSNPLVVWSRFNVPLSKCLMIFCYVPPWICFFVSHVVVWCWCGAGVIVDDVVSRSCGANDAVVVVVGCCADDFANDCVAVRGKVHDGSKSPRKQKQIKTNSKKSKQTQLNNRRHHRKRPEKDQKIAQATRNTNTHTPTNTQKAK